MKMHRPHIVAMLLMVFCMSIAFLAASAQINRLATESCFQALHQSTLQFSNSLRQSIRRECSSLEHVSRWVASLDKVESPEVHAILAMYPTTNMVSRVEILLPGDRILQSDGSYSDAAAYLSFHEKAALNAHVSSREADPLNPSKMILRCYAPIIKDGKTLALLCGVIDLNRLSQEYPQDELSRHALAHVIEGKSGNLLIDPVHPELGNTSESESKSPQEGYSAQQVALDMRTGRSGRTSFFSDTYQEYLYCDYAPVGINDWMVMMAQPESAAMESSREIQRILAVLAVLEGVFLSCYFVWLLRSSRQEAREKGIQLDLAQYMLEIESILFNAPSNPHLMSTALQKVSDFLTAESAFFLLRKDSGGLQARFWSIPSSIADQAWQAGGLKHDLVSLAMQLEKGSGMICRDRMEAQKRSKDALSLLKTYRLRNFMLIPAVDAGGRPVGAFGVLNTHRLWDTTELLDSVLLNFLTASNNIESFRVIQNMGRIDALTGLLNRNCFQEAMEQHERSGDMTLCCIYVDADGLHELNARCGHSGGDRLLQSVADAIRAEFDGSCIYRIGGDEFLAFPTGLDEAEVRQRVSRVSAGVEKDGYHVSIGVAWRKDTPLVYELVKKAEAAMYEVKRVYYETNSDLTHVRAPNEALEGLLMEKRDLDIFRTVLAAKYKGVYLVNLQLDTMRSIYIPPYFEEIFQSSGKKFSRAIATYCDTLIKPSYQAGFMEFIDFQQVAQRLDQCATSEFYYRRKDHTDILLRICRSPEYSAQMKECLWLFESVEAVDE